MREFNRALLARQLLLDRVDLGILDAVEHLVGLQAQATTPPYYGLWSRLRGFQADALSRAIEDGSLVRMTLMRGTVHMVTPRDAAFLRPLVQPAIDRGHQAAFGRRMGGVRVDAARVLEILRDGPRTAREIARVIGGDEEAVANAVRACAPIVQLPPRGVLGKGGAPRYTPLPVPLEASPSPETLVLLYLRAFGPATVMDCQRWCGLTRLKPVFERLELVRDGAYYDVPDAPRPSADTPAPVRFLGEFDNVLLGHADRSRIIPPDVPWTDRARSLNHVLVDGMLRATWWLDGGVLTIQPYGRIPQDEVAAEARRMAEFAGADDVRFEPALP